MYGCLFFRYFYIIQGGDSLDIRDIVDISGIVLGFQLEIVISNDRYSVVRTDTFIPKEDRPSFVEKFILSYSLGFKGKIINSTGIVDGRLVDMYGWYYKDTNYQLFILSSNGGMYVIVYSLDIRDRVPDLEEIVKELGGYLN